LFFSGKETTKSKKEQANRIFSSPMIIT